MKQKALNYNQTSDSLEEIEKSQNNGTMTLEFFVCDDFYMANEELIDLQRSVFDIARV